MRKIVVSPESNPQFKWRAKYSTDVDNHEESPTVRHSLIIIREPDTDSYFSLWQPFSTVTLIIDSQPMDFEFVGTDSEGHHFI